MPLPIDGGRPASPARSAQANPLQLLLALALAAIRPIARAVQQQVQQAVQVQAPTGTPGGSPTPTSSGGQTQSAPVAGATPRGPATSASSPAPTAPVVPSRPREYVDDTPDTPRAGRPSNRHIVYRPVVQTNRVPAELIAAASYNPVAQCMVHILRHEPLMFDVVLRSAYSFQDAMNKLVQDAGKENEWDEEVARIFEDAPDTLSDLENYGPLLLSPIRESHRPVTQNEPWRLWSTPNVLTQLAQGIILDVVYNVDLTSELDAIGSHGDWRDWSPAAVNEVYRAVTTTGLRLSLYEGQTASYVQRGDPASAFRTAIGPVEILLSNDTVHDDIPISWSAETIPARDEYGYRRNRIEVYSFALETRHNQQEADWFEYNLVHEFGHVFNNRLRGNAVNALALDTPVPHSEGWDGRYFETDLLPFTRQSPNETYGEIWADQFLFWVYDSFNETTVSREAGQNWMDEYVARFMNAAAIRDYSATEILKLPEIAGQVLTANAMNLNLRNQADMQISPETSIPTGATVEVLGRDSSGEWIAVAYGSSIGWVRSEFIQVNVSSISEVRQERLDYATGRSLVDSPASR